MVWDDNVEDLHDVGSRCLLLDTRALVMESTELALESTDLEKEDWWNASDRLLYTVSGASKLGDGAGRHCKKRNVASIVKSDVCNGLSPAIKSDIRPCERLDPPLWL